ncbi:MAG: hypothetical protein IPJ60_03970 [Sphingobacteriaceae bacterium]|nr:hypothetical protein [Sphingobacteriaceae bacterium]
MAHFLFVIWGAYPFNREPKRKMDFYAMTYCDPYFHQDWRMFAPGTRYNYSIYAVYEVNGQKQHSFPIQEVLEERTVFSGREFLMISLTDASIFVHNRAMNIKGDLYKFTNDKYYQIFEYVNIQYLQKKHKIKLRI